jgi:hypothetical protein
VLAGFVLLLATGEGPPNPFTQPLKVQIGFVALALILAGILLAWRWESRGGIMSLAGWILFVVAERISIRQGGFIMLLGVPSLLFLGSSFLRWRHEKHKST